MVIKQLKITHTNCPILVIDFQTTYSPEIYRILDELNIKYEKVEFYPGDEAVVNNKMAELHPSGLILTGSYDSVYNENARILSPSFSASLKLFHTPTLGICYGHQLLAHMFGGLVIANPDGIEHGEVVLSIEKPNFPLFEGLPNLIPVHMNHKDIVEQLPVCFKNYAHTPETRYAAIQYTQDNETLPIFGIQFHPEKCTNVVRKAIFQNFVKICANYSPLV